MFAFQLNQVWNQRSLSSLFEYKDEKAYIEGQKVIEKHFKESFLRKLFTAKKINTRTFNLLDYNY